MLTQTIRRPAVSRIVPKRDGGRVTEAAGPDAVQVVVCPDLVVAWPQDFVCGGHDQAGYVVPPVVERIEDRTLRKVSLKSEEDFIVARSTAELDGTGRNHDRFDCFIHRLRSVVDPDSLRPELGAHRLVQWPTSP
ncbi:hypothetical protein ACFWVF_21645 [Streptomyces sp. NPDC058659]|uniref:hypothetical protein n=1 Tax=unclassified Streptomyces TaxID=2593676 RepID=UPI00365EEC53